MYPFAIGGHAIENHPGSSQGTECHDYAFVTRRIVDYLVPPADIVRISPGLSVDYDPHDNIFISEITRARRAGGHKVGIGQRGYTIGAGTAGNDRVQREGSHIEEVTAGLRVSRVLAVALSSGGPARSRAFSCTAGGTANGVPAAAAGRKYHGKN